MKSFSPEILHPELRFKAVRSGGKGGQHVNKVSSAVELYFDVENSSLLSDEQKQLILDKLKNRISKEGELTIVSQAERSQFANKKNVIARFDELISLSLYKKKKRIPTKISQAKNQKRLNRKKERSEIKQLRKKEW